MEQRNTTRKTVFRWIRFLFFWFLIFGLWFTDFYTSRYGVPEWITTRIETKLEQAGIDVKTEQILFSFNRGFFCKNLQLTEQNNKIKINIPALWIDISPIELFHGVLMPIHIIINDGSAFIPLLPDAGPEGKMDSFFFRQINCEIKGVPGFLQVRNTNARLGNCIINADGTVNNVLHVCFEHLLRKIFSDIRNSKSKTDKTAAEKTEVPEKISRKWLQVYQILEKIKLAGTAQCNVKFYADLKDFKQNEMAAEISLPEIRYNHLDLKGIQEKITLKNGIFSIEQFSAQLGSGTEFTSGICYQNDKKSFSGTVQGTCQIQDFTNLLKPELRTKIDQHITFGNEKIQFSVCLNELSFINKKYDSSINLTIPEMTIHGIPLHHVKLSLKAENGNLTGTLHSASLQDHGNIKGDFLITTDGISCSVSGKTGIMIFRNIFPEIAQNYIKKNITFTQKEDRLTFNGTFQIKNWEKQDISGSVNLLYPHITVSGVQFQNISTELDFSSDLLHFKNTSAETTDGSRFSSSAVIDLKKEHISAKITCTGKPENLALSMEKILQTKTLVILSKDISSTVPDQKLEANLDFFADYSQNSHYSISGNVVMKNPSYCGVPFRYGAARFFVDSDSKLAIPDLILESDSGTLKMKSLYLPGKEEIAHFNIENTLPGNDILKIFCPSWNVPLFNFPFPIKFSASGVFNYTDQNKTAFEIYVQNGNCLFAGSKVSDLDTHLSFKNMTISFRNAEGLFCKGNFTADLEYNITRETGSFSQHLENADLTEFMKEFNISDMAPSGTGNGKLSFISNAKFYYPPETPNLIYMNGSGKLQLSGDELWDIPVLSSFLKYIRDAWPMIGRSTGITSLSSRIEFKDQNVVIEEVSTNGNLISMDADGTFNLNTGKYDLLFKAELLKNALPFEAMSKILTPFSWMLNKNYQGEYFFSK